MTEHEGFLQAYDRDKSAGNLWEWIKADRRRVLEDIFKPITEAIAEQERIGSDERASVAWQRLDKAVYETLAKLAELKELA